LINYLSDFIEKNLSKGDDEPRAYIGASSIGNPCERAIWYGLNKPEDKVITTRQLITFEIGKCLEEMTIHFLLEQLALISPWALECNEYPLFKGNADAIIVNSEREPIAILEIKTAKDSSFNIFKKKGLRLWYPEYYDQIQSYMGMSGINTGYLLALNKDTSELHDEKVDFDAERYKKLVEKAKRIGDARIMPPKINGSPSFFRCKFCFYRNACHEVK
jgi:hypothetical protein